MQDSQGDQLIADGTFEAWKFFLPLFFSYQDGLWWHGGKVMAFKVQVVATSKQSWGS